MTSLLSDELYDALEAMKYEIREDASKFPTGLKSTQWIHVQDAVSLGTITPLEAYDAIQLGYVPEHLTVRESKYTHLL